MWKYRLMAASLASVAAFAGGVYASTRCPSADVARQVYPAQLYPDGVVAIEHSNTPDQPLDLELYRQRNGCRRQVIDSYGVEGSAPTVQSVFHHLYEGQPYLFSIVSWHINSRGVGTVGTLYQVYGYKKTSHGSLQSDPAIAKMDSMTGIEGEADGRPAHFNGRTAAAVIQLLDRAH